MYVAITRAKHKLFVINSRSRYRFGKTEYFPKSRFIGEMTGVKQTMRFVNSNYKSPADDRRKLGANATMPSISRTPSPFKKEKETANVDFSKFTKNTVVDHSKFGRGIIVETSGDGEDKIASIAFKGLGIKRFALAIAVNCLTIVDEE